MTSGIGTDRCERGSATIITSIFLVFLMSGFWALMSASQQWNAHRDAHATAAAAARAGAQADPIALRSGITLDPAAAIARAEAVLSSSGHDGSVHVDGLTVTVTASSDIEYAFPAPGFAPTASGSAAAELVRGVDGTEGG